MSEKTKKIADSIGHVLEALPDEKKEELLRYSNAYADGYADGVKAADSAINRLNVCEETRNA